MSALAERTPHTGLEEEMTPFEAAFQAAELAMDQAGRIEDSQGLRQTAFDAYGDAASRYMHAHNNTPFVEVANANGVVFVDDKDNSSMHPAEIPRIKLGYSECLMKMIESGLLDEETEERYKDIVFRTVPIATKEAVAEEVQILEIPDLPADERLASEQAVATAAIIGATMIRALHETPPVELTAAFKNAKQALKDEDTDPSIITALEVAIDSDRVAQVYDMPSFVAREALTDMIHGSTGAIDALLQIAA